METVISRLENRQPQKNEGFLAKALKNNERVIREKENTSVEFIKQLAEKYEDLLKVVSFAGGKDSTVIAMLVKKALGSIPLFFSDTTLEFPETYAFIESFADKYGFKLIKDDSGKFYKYPQNFFKLCNELGPPSMRYRWCCTVFKAQPVNLFYKTVNGNVLAFDGIRKNESHAREKYQEVTLIKKICRQIASYPIFHWREVDVWFYILHKKIDYNPLYALGHTRVGCKFCPNASPSNCFFRKLTHPKLWSRFEKVLETYAQKYGKDRNWIDSNYWRLRLPKKDNVIAVSPHKPCGSDDYFIYDFKVPFDKQFLEHFKPFGEAVVKEISKSQYFEVESINPFKMWGVVGGSKLSVSFNPQVFPEAKKIFERQLTKALNCIGCGGCMGICPVGAIGISNGRMRIDSHLCTHCKKCLKTRCIAVDFKRRRKVVKDS